MPYKIENIFITALAAEKAKTVKFMFSIVLIDQIYKTVPHTHYNTNLCNTYYIFPDTY